MTNQSKPEIIEPQLNEGAKIMLANIAYSCGFIYLFLSVFIIATRNNNEEISDKIAVLNGIIAVVGLVCGLIAVITWVWA